MFNRIISLLMIILIFSTSTAFAEVKEKEEVEVYNKGIHINGERIINSHSVYPYFEYKDIVYMPLTVENSKILGFDLKWEEETKTISLTKQDPSLKNYKEQWIKQDWRTLQVKPSDIQVNIFGEAYINEDYPIFDFNYIAYVPLTYSVLNEFFGWDMYYNLYTGIYLSSIKELAASSTFDEDAFAYNKVLADYVMKINKRLTESEALEIVMLLKNKSELYDVDELLVFATMWQESNFDATCYYKGAIGLMQIMDSTGRMYDLTPEMLYDPEINVDFGVKYLKDKIDTYDGSVELALSAYNQGITRVNSGNYTTVYYGHVMGKKAKLEAYLEEQGMLPKQ